MSKETKVCLWICPLSKNYFFFKLLPKKIRKGGVYPPYGQNPQSSIWNRSLLIPESANFGTVALYIGRQMKFKSDYFQILVCNLTNGLEKHE